MKNYHPDLQTFNTNITKTLRNIFGEMEKRITFAPPLNTDVHLQSAKNNQNGC